jgi:hypothetical protein
MVACKSLKELDTYQIYHAVFKEQTPSLRGRNRATHAPLTINKLNSCESSNQAVMSQEELHAYSDRLSRKARDLVRDVPDMRPLEARDVKHLMQHLILQWRTTIKDVNGTIPIHSLPILFDHERDEVEGIRLVKVDKSLEIQGKGNAVQELPKQLSNYIRKFFAGFTTQISLDVSNKASRAFD